MANSSPNFFYSDSFVAPASCQLSILGFASSVAQCPRQAAIKMTSLRLSVAQALLPARRCYAAILPDLGSRPASHRI